MRTPVAVCLCTLAILSPHLLPVPSTDLYEALRASQQRDKHMGGGGLREAGDNSCPPGLCAMVDVRVKD